MRSESSTALQMPDPVKNYSFTTGEGDMFYSRFPPRPRNRADLEAAKETAKEHKQKIAKLEEDLKKKVATITELQNKLGERKKEVEDLRARLRDASQGQRRSGPARDGYAKRRDSDRDRSPSPRERQRDAWRRRN